MLELKQLSQSRSRREQLYYTRYLLELKQLYKGSVRYM